MGKMTEQHKLEDYEPGATKKEVIDALRTVVKTPTKAKKPQKRVAQPEQASS